MKMFFLLLATHLFSIWTGTIMAAIININDGASHVIDYYQSDGFYLDYEASNDPGTHINLIEDGSVEFLVAWNNSTVTINGGTAVSGTFAQNNSVITMYTGTIGNSLRVEDNSTATINGGTIERFSTTGNGISFFNNGRINDYLSALSNATVVMNGGTVGWVGALDNGVLTISGGSIDRYIQAAIEGIVYLKGSGFEVNGESLSYGDKLRDFATHSGNNIYTGTITGILSDGSVLNNDFEIQNTAEIIIIPEPATALLLSLGGIVLIKKKKV